MEKTRRKIGKRQAKTGTNGKILSIPIFGITMKYRLTMPTTLTVLQFYASLFLIRIHGVNVYFKLKYWKLTQTSGIKSPYSPFQSYSTCFVEFTVSEGAEDWNGFEKSFTAISFHHNLCSNINLHVNLMILKCWIDFKTYQSILFSASSAACNVRLIKFQVEITDGIKDKGSSSFRARKLWAKILVFFNSFNIVMFVSIINNIAWVWINFRIQIKKKRKIVRW